MKTRKKKLSWLLSLLAIFCMILGSSLTAFAADGDNGLIAAEDPRESVLMIQLGYEDDTGDFQWFKQGTCFLINDEYVLTNRHVVTIMDYEVDEFKTFVRDNFGVADVSLNDSHIKLYMYVNRDMKIQATMHESVNSKDMDFAAVKLAEKIYDRHPLALGDSDTLVERQDVFALGFPDDSLKDRKYNTKQDVSTVDGTVSKLTESDNQGDIIEHTAQLSAGNSGGPLLDANNNVVGVNRFQEGNKSYSIQINVIKAGLDTFGIAYVTGGTISPEPEPNPPEPEPDPAQERIQSLRENLQSVLSSAKSMDVSGYTDDSVKALNDSIAAAEAVIGNADATEGELQSAADSINNAVNELTEKSSPNILIIGIIAAVVIIAVNLTPQNRVWIA